MYSVRMGRLVWDSVTFTAGKPRFRVVHIKPRHSDSHSDRQTVIQPVIKTVRLPVIQTVIQTLSQLVSQTVFQTVRHHHASRPPSVPSSRGLRVLKGKALQFTKFLAVNVTARMLYYY